MLHLRRNAALSACLLTLLPALAARGIAAVPYAHPHPPEFHGDEHTHHQDPVSPETAIDVAPRWMVDDQVRYLWEGVSRQNTAGGATPPGGVQRDMTFSFDLRLTVTNVAENGDVSFVLTFERINVAVPTEDEEVRFDSTIPPSERKPSAMAYGLHMPFRILDTARVRIDTDRHGSILRVDSLESITKNDGFSATMLDRFVSERAIASRLGPLFALGNREDSAFLPLSWERVYTQRLGEAGTMEMPWKYTLESLTTDMAKVTVTAARTPLIPPPPADEQGNRSETPEMRKYTVQGESTWDLRTRRLNTFTLVEDSLLHWKFDPNQPAADVTIHNEATLSRLPDAPPPKPHADAAATPVPEPEPDAPNVPAKLTRPSDRKK